jgi:hypothetical protein
MFMAFDPVPDAGRCGRQKSNASLYTAKSAVTAPHGRRMYIQLAAIEAWRTAGGVHQLRPFRPAFRDHLQVAPAHRRRVEAFGRNDRDLGWRELQLLIALCLTKNKKWYAVFRVEQTTRGDRKGGYFVEGW